ncbi:inosine 5'-monophosphate dehydrogenase [Posidoniimonas corsicana]|uniref:Inosine 5'-monophosphate dehydrogenase n=1 Tax=Posidoniimonas corsicana TaxID=1938618 RepID=A0A5C5VFE8_9BACT|nr:CBS domain-containing protein [Posidoniimonas corsicana]TWT36813.1 inosine 5'-monophosphate dehydrogenase [Posidoniimonas corsicana]
MDFQLSLSSESVGATQPDTPLATAPDEPLANVLGLLRAQKQAAVMVCDGAKLVGIFTERDALRLLAEGADLAAPVSSAMSTDLMTIRPETTVGQAIRLMSEGGYRHLPVVDPDDSPTGVVAVRGIVHYLVEHFPDAVYTQSPTGDRPTAEREGA